MKVLVAPIFFLIFFSTFMNFNHAYNTFACCVLRFLKKLCYSDYIIINQTFIIALYMISYEFIYMHDMSILINAPFITIFNFNLIIIFFT
jgi:hypothetical protein